MIETFALEQDRGLGNQDPYWRWRLRLSEYQKTGNVLPTDPQSPEPGCYRMKWGADWLGVRIWEGAPDANGEIKCFATLAQSICPIATVWPRCAKTPVSSASYRHWMQGTTTKALGKWPDDVTDEIPCNGNNIAAAPENESLMASILALETSAIAWFEAIGSEIKTQDHADRAANYAQAFLELEKQAATAKQTALKPLVKAVDTERAIWTALEEKASLNKKQIKTFWLLPSGFTIAGSGPGNRASRVVRHFAAFTDLRAFLRWIGSTDVKLPDSLKVAALRVARRVLSDPDAEVPPGVEVKEKETYW
jgi:hypothetical protein